MKINSTGSISKGPAFGEKTTGLIIRPDHLKGFNNNYQLIIGETNKGSKIGRFKLDEQDL